jgi:hypothetical protein
MLFVRVRFFMPLVFLAGAFAGCSGAGHSLPPPALQPSSLSALGTPPRLNLAVPRRPAFIDTVPAAPAPLAPLGSNRATSTVTHPSFFAGEVALNNGVYYLQLPNSNIFGYYSYLPDPHYIYHFDLGYEYLIDANDGAGGLYLYDFASGHWWYTGRQYPFPYLYDFTLGAFLYYFPDTKNPQHYTTSPRFFYSFTASQIVTIPSALAAPAVGYLGPASNGSVAGILNNVSSDVLFVGISGAQVSGGPNKTVPTAGVTIGYGPTVLSTRRAPRTVDAAHAVRAVVERPVEGPDEVAALTRRLHRVVSAPTSVRRTRSVGTTVGSKNPFWTFTGAIGAGGSTYAQRSATLKVVTDHGYVWIDDTLVSPSAADITAIANDFENAYASDTTHFGTAAYTASSAGMTSGSNPACDANGVSTGTTVPNFIVPTDGKIDVFVVDIQGLGTGVGGYFSSANYIYQSALNCLIGHNGVTAQNVPRSNELPMFVVGYNTGVFSNPAQNNDFEDREDVVRGTSHEFQHLINFVNHAILNNVNSEEVWLNEGLSMLAQDLAVNRMFPSVPVDIMDAAGRAHLYLQAPETYSLTAFTSVDSFDPTNQQYNCSGCYGEEYLFQRYLYDRFGGDAYLHKMLGASTGFANLQQATGTDPTQTIGDFAIAIAASGTGTTTDPRFGFTGINLHATYSDQFGTGGYAFNGPATLPIASGTTVYPLGGFFYLEDHAAALGKTVSANTTSGAFKLKAGVVQR